MLTLLVVISGALVIMAIAAAVNRRREEPALSGRTSGTDDASIELAARDGRQDGGSDCATRTPAADAMVAVEVANKIRYALPAAPLRAYELAPLDVMSARQKGISMTMCALAVAFLTLGSFTHPRKRTQREHRPWVRGISILRKPALEPIRFRKRLRSPFLTTRLNRRRGGSKWSMRRVSRLLLVERTARWKPASRQGLQRSDPLAGKLEPDKQGALLRHGVDD